MSNQSLIIKRVVCAIGTSLAFGLSIVSYASEPRSVVASAVGNEQVLDYSGFVEAVRQTSLEIEVAGRVTELLVRPGDSVEQGQPLVRVDARTARDRALLQEAEVEAANAEMAVANAELRRQQNLYAKGSLSQSALDRAEAQHRVAQAAARARLAAASAARTTADQHILRAPYRGRISEVIARLGDLAAPGVPLVRIYDPTKLRVKLAIPERDVSAVAKAALGNIDIRLRGSSTVSPLERVLVPELNPLGHSAAMELYLPEAIDVLPGAYAKVVFRIAADVAPASIRVPRSSVLMRSEARAVYVLSEDGTRLRLVRTGRTIGEDIEVLSGLALGERVIVNPESVVVNQHDK
ncbi:efflux RND transporter periplasmic adaptor subunit [Zhongshania marina]|uniref:Efflux RND transporter periplasmic adaptor subunit n=1 Tax=Zhongshania marina TaxID=2304603 RepID=A0ABX9W4A7_9GAMM|nr:efflux RND transporter periplasmic adaptor subunit [Zhongshania marina]